MTSRKTAYEIRQSQVRTPAKVVPLFWRLIHKHRERLGGVLDMGAGDGRLAHGGRYDRYEGVEMDPVRSEGARLPAHASLTTGCVFRHSGADYDACIGNPPYVRHHDIESPWKERTAERIHKELNVELDRHCNLYVYFLCLGLMKSCSDGLVALIVPFEWVSRPSVSAVRRIVDDQGWDVSVYRFQKAVFDGVLTTASISIISKRGDKGRWEFHDILPDLTTKPRHGISGNSHAILDYAERGDVWARRGLSPGSQRVFALTEGERVHAGLWRSDVLPCVTSLRGLPGSLRQLTQAAFRKHYVEAGRRCWLIRSTGASLSPRLKAYLDGVPEESRQTYTCRNQNPWYAYEQAPVPQMLVSSSFMKFGPKVLVNSVRAQAAGVVYGVNSEKRVAWRKLQKHLLGFDFEKRVVAHADTLRKVEVRQLNAVLSAWLEGRRGSD